MTGDTDNGSSIDVSNGTVAVDLDVGENITVVFKNKKIGDDELFDFGDAPDGTVHSRLSMDAYFHRIIWDGKDKKNNQLPSGIYLYQLKAGSFNDVKKLISLK